MESKEQMAKLRSAVVAAGATFHEDLDEIPLLGQGEDEDQEISLSDLDITHSDHSMVILIGSIAIVGGLKQESDAEDPLTRGDGVGTIHQHEHAADEFWGAFGYLKSDEAPHYSVSDVEMHTSINVLKLFQEDDALLEDLTARLETDGILLPRKNETTIAAFQRCIENEFVDGKVCFSDLQNMVGDTDQAVALFEHFGLTDDVLEAAAKNAFVAALSSGGVGDMLAVALSCTGYYSKTVKVIGSVADVAPERGMAVWVPDGCARENILDTVKRQHPTLVVGSAAHNKALRDEAVSYAKSCIEEWNHWQDGEVYGVISHVVDRSTGEILSDDSCWGYYGTDYAYEELMGRMLNELDAAVQSSKPEPLLLAA